MKKIFLFAAMAAIAASSCTKVDEEAIASTSSANSDGSISFGLYTSRVTTNTITELQGMQPQIESYQTETSYASYATTGDYPAHMVDRNLFYTAGTGRWAVNGIYFWPDSSESSDVISFFSTTADDSTSALSTPTYADATAYPSFDYTVVADTETQKIDGTTGAVTAAMAADDNNMEDILVASEMDKSSGQVNLSYQHAMSRVNFKIQGESTGGKYTPAAKDADGNYYTDENGNLLYQETYNGYLLYKGNNDNEYYKVDAYYTKYSGNTIYYVTSTNIIEVTVYTDTENSNTLVYSTDSGSSYYTFDGEEYNPATTASYTAVTVFDADGASYAKFYINKEDNYELIYETSAAYYTADGDATYTDTTSLEITAVPAEEIDIDYEYTLKYIKIGALANSGTFTFNGYNSYDSVPGSWSDQSGNTSYGYYFEPATVTNTEVADLRIFANDNYVDATNSLMIMPNNYETNSEFEIVVRYAVSSPGWYDDVDMSSDGGIDGANQSGGNSANIADAVEGEIYIATVTAKVAYDFVEGESTTITVTLPSPGDLITFEAGVGTFDEKYYTASVDKVEDVDDDYVVVVKLPSEN